MSKSTSTPKKYNNKLRRELAAYVKENATIFQLRQYRPYTFVELHLDLAGSFNLVFTGPRKFIAFGFSKVNWPDVWDSHYGLELATEKAAFIIAKQILCRNDAFVYVETLGLSIDRQLESFKAIAEGLVAS